MAITYGPYSGQSTTDAQYARLAREWIPDGVAGSVGDTTLKVTADSTGMKVDVAAGFAVIRGTFFRSTASEPVTIAVADAQPRIDIIVVRLDPALGVSSLAVVQGTAGSSPTPPALTQNDVGDYDFPLAHVAVGGGAVTIAAVNVTDVRRFAASWTTATRPESPRVGRSGYNATLEAYEFWDGEAWLNMRDASQLNAGTLHVDRLPSGIDAATVDGRQISSGTTLPATGNDGDIFFLHE